MGRREMKTPTKKKIEKKKKNVTPTMLEKKKNRTNSQDVKAVNCS